MTPLIIGLHISFSLIRPTTVGLLDCSGSAKPSGYLTVLDNDGDIARAFREFQHLRQGLRILLDIMVREWDVSPGVVLTGRRGIGSGIFPVDDDWCLHDFLHALHSV